MVRSREKVGNDIYGVKNDWKMKQRLGETAETGFRHNDHYHKYFHGYTEVRIEKENGKYRIERYYTDDWYMQDVSDRKWYAYKLLMPLLTVLSAVAYFSLMSLPGLEGNTSHIAAVPGFLAVPVFVLLFASSLGYAGTKRKMTWWEQHTSAQRIKWFSLAEAVLLLLTGLLILFMIFGGTADVAGEIMLGLGVIAAAAGPLAMYVLEHRMRYKTEKNDVKLPDGEYHVIL